MADLNVSLLIRAVDQATRPIKGITKSVNNMTKAWKGAKFEGLQRSLKGVGTAIGGVGTAAKQTGVRLAVLGGAATLGLRGLINTASEFEILDVRIKALMGSAEGAEQATKWIENFTATTPGSVKGVTDAFALLKNFGFDPMDGTMKKIMDQTSKLGFSQEKLMGISLALGQSWAAQKLQGQDINQLINQGIPVYELLSKALGKTVPQIKAMSSAGTINREEMQKMIDLMGTEAAGASEAMMNTWQGLVSNLTDQWDLFKRAIMRGGLFDFLKGGLKDVLGDINRMAASGELKMWAKEIGAEIQKIIKIAIEFGSKLRYAFGAIMAIADPFIGILGGVNTALLAISIYTFGPLIKALFGLASSIVTVGKEAWALRATFLQGIATMKAYAVTIWTRIITALGAMRTTLLTRVIPAIIAKVSLIWTTAIPSLIAYATTIWAKMLPALTALIAKLAVIAAPVMAIAAAFAAVGLAVRELIRIWDELDFGDVFKGIKESIMGEGGIMGTFNELFDMTKLLQNYGLLPGSGANQMPGATTAPALPAGAGAGGKGGDAKASVNIFAQPGVGVTSSTQTSGDTDVGYFGY